MDGDKCLNCKKLCNAAYCSDKCYKNRMARLRYKKMREAYVNYSRLLEIEKKYHELLKNPNITMDQIVAAQNHMLERSRKPHQLCLSETLFGNITKEPLYLKSERYEPGQRERGVITNIFGMDVIVDPRIEGWCIVERGFR